MMGIDQLLDEIFSNGGKHRLLLWIAKLAVLVLRAYIRAQRAKESVKAKVRRNTPKPPNLK